MFIKYIITIILLFPLCTWAQDCQLHRETDPYTKEIKISTGFIDLQGASVTIDADKAEIDFFFSLDGSTKCFDNNSIAAVFFEGSKVKLSYRNSGSMNCEGFFHFTFKNSVGTISGLQKLSSQKIASIIFTDSNKKQITVTLEPAQQTALISLATCLVNEAKTLVK